MIKAEILAAIGEQERAKPKRTASTPSPDSRFAPSTVDQAETLRIRKGQPMSSRFGLTVDEALARVMVAERIPDEAERRQEYRKILGDVRSLAYHVGSEEER